MNSHQPTFAIQIAARLDESPYPVVYLLEKRCKSSANALEGVLRDKGSNPNK